MKNSVVFLVQHLQSGGAEKQMLWIAKTLAGEGWHCDIIEMRAAPRNERINIVIRDAMNGGVVIHEAEGSGVASYARAASRLWSHLRSKPETVLWTWGFRADALAVTILLGRKPSSWIVSLRNANALALHRARFLLRLCEPKVKLYVANTWSNCEMLAVQQPRALARCRVLYNALEELRCEPVILPEERPFPLRIMMLGNIDPWRKGYDYLLELAQRLLRAPHGVKIHIAGRSEADDWLPREIRRRDLGSVVVYHGEAPDPMHFLRGGHAFLLTSRVEGTPNALLEAMSLNLPAVSSRVGDLDRLASDKLHLRLVDVGSVEQCMHAIEDICSRWTDAIEMGRRGRLWCEEHFGVESARRHLLEIMEEVTRRP
jgi:GalNAc-alpha-(1->4)-GalNAc-alpha-(1->3)-diNAcBac-PP-undecaprenol alpha-1,4-N-acetyl-D-galactosaminyltransferase